MQDLLDTLKQCVDEGMGLIDQALSLETDLVKNASSLNVKTLSDQQLAADQDHLKVFESARSYKASLLFQAMRVAEMEGNNADRDRLKTEAEAARAHFLELSDIVKKIQAEIDARTKAKEEEANTQKANAAANKK